MSESYKVKTDSSKISNKGKFMGNYCKILNENIEEENLVLSTPLPVKYCARHIGKEAEDIDA